MNLASCRQQAYEDSSYFTHCVYHAIVCMYREVNHTLQTFGDCH